jgi:hypothetical protein
VDYGATVRFDADELAAAFAHMAPAGSMQLNLEADTLTPDVAVYLQNSTQSYRFTKVQVRVFSM